MRFINQEIIASQSAATNVTSQAVSIEQMPNYTIQLAFTGSCVGTARLQASNDIGDDAVPANWTEIAGSTLAIAAATTSAYMWVDSCAHYRWVRVVYTATSGTGNISARINCNGAQN